MSSHWQVRVCYSRMSQMGPSPMGELSADKRVAFRERMVSVLTYLPQMYMHEAGGWSCGTFPSRCRRNLTHLLSCPRADTRRRADEHARAESRLLVTWGSKPWIRVCTR